MHLGLGNSQKAKRFRKFVTRSSTKFDGTDDQVLLPVALPSTFSVSFWFKQTDTRNGDYLFDSRNSSDQAFAAWSTYDSGTNSHVITVWCGTTVVGTTKISVGTWAHVALTKNGNTVSIYVDGVFDNSGTNATFATTTTSDIKVGTRYTGGNAWQGSQDEWAIFSTALTERQVSDLYNNGQPTKIGNNPNLSHWFRMGEGKLDGKSDGESNLLFDQGPNGGLGSELMTNGDFSSSSGWTLDSNASVSGGKLVLASSTGLSYQGIDLDNDAAYEVTFTIENFSTGTVKAYLNGTNGTVRNANGTYKEIVLAGSANTLVGINPSGSMNIDNFSVKKLENVGTINGPAIQADGGTELITNGTYDTDTTGWTAHSYSSTTALSVVSGKLRVTSSTSYGFAYQGFPTRVGGVYSYTVEGTKGTSPSWDAFFGTHFNGAQNVSAVSQGGSDSQGTTGTVSGTFTATATTTFITLRSRNEGSVTDAFTEFDNVSVKEVTESVPKKTQNLPSAGSAKSLSFDATDEFVDTGLQPDFIHTDATVSFWCKMANFSGFQALGCFSSGKQFYVGFNGTAAGFALQATGKSSTDISAHITAGLWHHIALVADGGTATYYVDGVARDTHSYTPAASANPDTNFYIGAIPDGSGGRTYHMEGSVSEVAIWDTALDGDAVKALYNAGQPTPVTTKTGAYDIYRDNLKAYYKMGDGTDPAADGTSNLLFDQTNPGLGSEKVTNGTFDGVADGTDPVGNISGWAAYSSVTTREISGEKLKLVTTSSGSGALLEISGLTTGQTYKFTCDFVDVNGVNIASNSGTLWSVFTSNSPAASDGKITMFATISSGTSIGIYFRCNGAVGTGGTAYFDNISFKEVNGHTGTITGASIQTEAPKAIYALPPVTPSTKSLNFDSTNDHLVTQVDATAQPNNESRYYSWWYKSPSSAGSKETVFSHGAENRGMFAFNWSSNRNLLYMASSVLRYWNSNSKSSDNAWHHWVLRIKYNDITGCELWCDGEKQTVNATTNSGSMNTYTSGITIGAGLDNSRYLGGSLDEFSIHEDLDSESIRALFNRGRPIDISKSQGAYDVSDKALHWWRMGDAPVGQIGSSGDVLFQGFSEEDSELLTNGDFETGDLTGWTSSGSTVSVATNGAGSNALYISTSGASAFAQQNVSGIAGTIKVTFDLEVVSGGGTHVVMDGIQTTFASSGSYTMFHTSDGSTDVKFLRSGATEFYVDNVSVKQVRGQYIGPELVKADADLYQASTWGAYGGNVETFPNGTAAKFDRPSSGGDTRGGYVSLTSSEALTSNLENGCVYKLQFNFLTDDSDAFPRYYDGSSYTNFSAGSGLKVHYFGFSGSGFINVDDLTADKFVQFSNLSVTKVGGAAVMTNMTTSDLQLDTPY